jgi:hypothetical protein
VHSQRLAANSIMNLQAICCAHPNTPTPSLCFCTACRHSQHKYMQRLAANAIMNMAYDCAESRIAIAEAGAIPPLVTMLKIQSRSCQVRENRLLDLKYMALLVQTMSMSKSHCVLAVGSNVVH